MAGASLRTTFNRSGLVRILSGTLPETVDPQYDFGERLGQWLDFTDALALSSVLNGSTGAATAVQTPAAAGPLAEQLARVRRNLSESIANDGVFGGEPARIRFPTPLPQATPESAADFSPYHRYYLAHQREMAAAIGALRANARKALAVGEPAQRRLAELDATFEKTLAVRERNLLAMIPIMLAQPFTQRLQEYRATLPAPDHDDPADWAVAGGWLEAFCRDVQAVLAAELEFRLKPVAGLIAALSQTAATSQDSPQ